MTDVYDDIPRRSGNGNFVRWETVGDSVAGVLTAIDRGTDYAGEPCPQLTITTDNGEDRTVTVAQWDLQEKVYELRPQIGQRIAIVFTDQEQLQGGRTKKLFDVVLGDTADLSTTTNPPARPSAADLI